MSFGGLTPPLRRRGKEIKPSNNAMDMESIRARRARLEEIINSMRLPPLTQESQSVHGSLSLLRGQEARGPSSDWLSVRRSHSFSESTSRRPQPLTPEKGVQSYPFVSRPYATPLPGIGQRSLLTPTPLPHKQVRSLFSFSAMETGRPGEERGSDADDEDDEADQDSPEILQKIVKGLASHSSSKQLASAMRARKMLSRDSNPPIEGFLEAGILTPLLPLMQESDNSSEAEVREQAAWALGNVAGDGPESRDAVLLGGILQPLVKIIKTGEEEDSTKVSTVRVVAWVFANIFRNKKLALNPDELKDSIATLKVLVNYPDEEVNVDALWALSYLSEQGDEEIEGVLGEDLLPVIVRHLESERSKMVVPALRASGNIVSGNDAQTEAALAAGVLPLYKLLLRNTRRNIRKETAWALSNVTAGTKEQIQQVVDEGLLPELVRVIEEVNDML
ncbi:putative importin subunit alpha-5 [Penaeus vannamei]|uniref:Putative importin subunit alpha-5 n=1 Tax=Penaeus vannamei TaxID=6689 RepID=A0A3R7NFU0_PENVA|nr:putative importin subunit alpha-5 [Penaeus vannamei]